MTKIFAYAIRKDEEPFFSLKLSYKEDKLVEVSLNGKELKKNWNKKIKENVK